MTLMFCHDRVWDLLIGARDEIGGNVDQDDVSAVAVANMFCLFLKSARRQCALCIRFISVGVFWIHVECCPTVSGGGPHMLKVRLDTFHALPRISCLVKKSHRSFKPSMTWLRDACYIVNLEDIEEASGFNVTCVGVWISDMERL